MSEDAPNKSAEAPLVREVLPRLALGLKRELLELGEHDLADQVDDLRVGQPCSCGDDFCQSFNTGDREPGSPYGPDHRTVPLLPDSVMVNLDVVGGRIVYVEIIV
jgi:hypothetical protein